MSKNEELYQGMSEEEKAFYDEMYGREKEKAERKKTRVNSHKWNRDGIGKHYTRILFVPESQAETFGGSIALPSKKLVHRGIKSWDKHSKKMAGLFPNAGHWDVPHFPDDDQCLVCKKLVTVQRQLDAAIAANDVQLVKSLERMVQCKAKWRRIWVGVNYTFNKEAKTWDKEIELWELAEFFWRQSVESKIIKARATDIDEWLEQNAEELDGLSEEEVQFRYLKDAPPAHCAPWDMKNGYKMRIVKSGSFGPELTWDVAKLETQPFVPLNPKKGAKLSDEAKKLVALSKANHEWLKEQFASGNVPNINELYPVLKTVEQQAELLGIKRNGPEIQDEDSRETVANKLDEAGMLDDEKDTIDLDELSDERGEEDEVLKPETEDEGSKDDMDDDLDLDSLDLGDDDEIPF